MLIRFKRTNHNEALSYFLRDWPTVVTPTLPFRLLQIFVNFSTKIASTPETDIGYFLSAIERVWSTWRGTSRVQLNCTRYGNYAFVKVVHRDGPLLLALRNWGPGVPDVEYQEPHWASTLTTHCIRANKNKKNDKFTKLHTYLVPTYKTKVGQKRLRNKEK